MELVFIFKTRIKIIKLTTSIPCPTRTCKWVLEKKNTKSLIKNHKIKDLRIT